MLDLPPTKSPRRLNSAASAQPSHRRFRAWLLPAAALLLAVGFIYAPALRGDWLWDDNSEITSNLDLRGPDALWKIWFAPTSPDYFPLKTTVQWAQWQLWQDHATFGYHLTNLALHLLGALLLWQLLAQLGVRLAWLGGLLFAVHPLAVESVAWIAELKNVLSLPPLLLALSAFLDYDAHKTRPAYARALGWFVVALLCKSSVVMLPCVLLLWSAWQHRRLTWSAVAATLPFFVTAAVFGAVTLWFQHHRAIGGTELPAEGIAARIADAGRTMVFYFSKCLWPFPLAPIYPRWSSAPPGPGQLLPWIFIGATFAVAWWQRASWGRHVLLGLGFFLLNLLPVLGLIPMSYQQIAPVADHFAYVPLAGFAGLVAVGIGALQTSFSTVYRFLIPAAALAAAALLAGESRNYARVFTDQETLWTYALRRNPESGTAHNNLGAVRLRQRKWADAANHLEQAVRLNPRDAIAQLNLGNAFAKLDRSAEAIAHYETALRLDPAAAEAHFNLANLLVQNGRHAEAIAHYREALRLGPASVDVQTNLANALAQSGQLEEAMTRYSEALRLQPEAFGPHLNLGNLLAAAGRFPEAAVHFETATRLAPDSAEAHYALADIRVEIGRLPEAFAEYANAVQLAPNHAAIHTSWGNALLQSGRAADAIPHYEAALRLDPGDTEARTHLLQARRTPTNRAQN